MSCTCRNTQPGCFGICSRPNAPKRDEDRVHTHLLVHTYQYTYNQGTSITLNV